MLLGVSYLSALSLLAVWEYRGHLEGLSAECQLRDQTKSSLYDRPYTGLLNYASSNAAGHVVTVAIPPDLEEVQSNLCLGRAYMADVLRALGTLNPAVVVLDKFYGADTCASEPASTRNLIEAVESLKVPVVIGESTNGLETETSGACLVRRQQLHFDLPNVRHGLTRLNSESERIPLRWAVLSSAPAADSGQTPARSADSAQAEMADSLSFAAVKAYDPVFARRHDIQQLVRHDDHAYANLSVDIPGITTTALLCAAGDETVRQRWSLSCSGQPALPSMAGRVVLIGEENATDERFVLERHMWGFELQARYIETLLSGDYLRYLPAAIGFALFALFIFLIEGLPTILIAGRPRWKKKALMRHAYPQRRYAWVMFWTFAVILGTTVVSLALRYLPPLLVFGDILLVAVTRLLFFAAESAQHPFVHAHQHRKAHNMSDHKAAPHANHLSSHSSEHEAAAPSSTEESAKPLMESELATPMEASAAAAPRVVSNNKPGGEGGTAG